jgi:hypothetical protein
MRDRFSELRALSTGVRVEDTHMWVDGPVLHTTGVAVDVREIELPYLSTPTSGVHDH